MDTLGEENLIIHVESLSISQHRIGWWFPCLANSCSHCVKGITGLCFM